MVIIHSSVLYFWRVFHRRPKRPSTYFFTVTPLFSSPSWCTFSALHYERENGCRTVTSKWKLIDFSRGRKTYEGAAKRCTCKFFFLLIVLIVSFVPSIILLTMRFLMEGLFVACAIKVQIVNLMADNLICLKFLLDPVVYVWRIPKYH